MDRYCSRERLGKGGVDMAGGRGMGWPGRWWEYRLQVWLAGADGDGGGIAGGNGRHKQSLWFYFI